MFLELEKEILCNDEERRECITTIKQMAALAEIARTKRSVSNLYENVRTHESFLLINGLKLLEDGVPVEILKEILENYIKSSNKEYKALLDDFLMAEGILMLQHGYPPDTISRVLVSNLGEKIASEFLTSEGLANYE